MAQESTDAQVPPLEAPSESFKNRLFSGGSMFWKEGVMWDFKGGSVWLGSSWLMSAGETCVEPVPLLALKGVPSMLK